MPKLLAILGLTVALVGASPTTAGADPVTPQRATPTPTTGVGLPLSSPRSATVPPRGFSSTAEQAIAVAKATPKVQALHRREHPLTFEPWIWSGDQWFIAFSYRGKLVAEVDVSRSGRLIAAWTGPQAIAVYTRGHYAPLFDAWWVVLPFTLLFLAPFLDVRRLHRLLHLDALAMASFLLSYWLFDHAHLAAAVWLAYPPLLYLLVRMIRIGVSGGTRHGGLAGLLPVRVLGVGVLVLAAARIALCFVNPTVTDVGFASVIGAHRIVHGQSLYYATFAHGDTYGPIAYLAYVPFELLFPWHGAWDYLLSARVASIAFDLATVAGLVVLGRRLKPGPEGTRLGLVLGWAWCACPFTLLALMMHTNDGLVAMLSVFSLVAFSSPAARGALLGLAAAAKFSPAALLPLFASHRDRGPKGTIVCVAAFLVVVSVAVGLFLPSGGLGEFYDHTIGYQLSRPDVFSPWALHPSLGPLKALVEAGAVLLVGLVAFVPRRRSLVQTSALAAAVTVAVQLPAVHWFYFYIVWFVPFALVALLGDHQPPDRPQAEPEHGASELRLDGAPAQALQLAGV